MYQKVTNEMKYTVYRQNCNHLMSRSNVILQVDVIVCMVDKTLDLKKDADSNKLLNAAGKQIQVGYSIDQSVGIFSLV